LPVDGRIALMMPYGDSVSTGICFPPIQISPFRAESTARVNVNAKCVPSTYSKPVADEYADGGQFGQQTDG